VHRPAFEDLEGKGEKRKREKGEGHARRPLTAREGRGIEPISIPSPPTCRRGREGKKRKGGKGEKKQTVSTTDLSLFAGTWKNPQNDLKSFPRPEEGGGGGKKQAPRSPHLDDEVKSRTWFSLRPPSGEGKKKKKKKEKKGKGWVTRGAVGSLSMVPVGRGGNHLGSRPSRLLLRGEKGKKKRGGKKGGER